MPIFNYLVLDQNGERVAGKIDAPSKETVEQYLIEKEFTILNVSLMKESKNVEDIVARFRPIKLELLVSFSRQLATMIDAEMSTLVSLNALTEEETNPKFKEIILDVSRKVESGMALSEACSHHPELFNNLYVSMIKSGEESGNLPDSLKELSTQLEKQLKLRRAVKSATMYPRVVLFIAFLMISGLLISIVPKFADIFVETVNSTYDPNSGKPRPDDSLPGPTQFVLTISRVLYPKTEHHDLMWWGQVSLRLFGAVIVFTLLATLWKRILREPGPRRTWDSFKLNAPLKIGPLVVKLSVARFSRTFASLLRSGVPIVTALDIVAETSGNVLLTEAVLKAKERMLSGTTMYEPLAKAKIFPSMVTRMIQVGETTGRLEDMLIRIADFYEEEVDLAIKGLTSLIEPLMIMVVGLAIGGIILVTYLPMFKIYDLIG